jgi:hypothetical protein
MATVDYFLSYVFSSNADTLNISFSVRGKAKIRNNLNNARLAIFTRSISFAFIRYSADYNICSPLWQAAQHLRGAGDIPTHVPML